MDKKTYTPAQKKAIMTYREKNKEAYNEYATDYYQKKKMDEEWKEKFNERCKIANKKMREKKKLESPPKKRGRPKKSI